MHAACFERHQHARLLDTATCVRQGRRRVAGVFAACNPQVCVAQRNAAMHMCQIQNIATAAGLPM